MNLLYVPMAAQSVPTDDGCEIVVSCPRPATGTLRLAVQTAEATITLTLTRYQAQELASILDTATDRIPGDSISSVSAVEKAAVLLGYEPVSAVQAARERGEAA